ncbi:MAG: PEP-utilizing enzyme [Syntrophobacterales bacterium]|nr:PEP-utilizing enzyme [Syntrophobacterales bacterium]
MSIISWLRKIFKNREHPPTRQSELFRLKYQHFKELLDSNTEMAKVISEIEDKLQGKTMFGMSHVRSMATRSIFHSFRMIERLNSLSNKGYLELYDVHHHIQTQIKNILEEHREASEAAWILQYNNISQEMIEKVGGKNANLGEMYTKLGLPIPRGFAITVDAFHLFMEANDLRNEINKILMETDFQNLQAIEESSEIIQGKIISGKIPDGLAQAILEAYDNLAKSIGSNINVALRSSAIGEDGDISFAGQYVSVLNVPREQILRSYRYVLASLYTPRAIAYRFRMGIDDQYCAMSVGCLEMIPSVASGVCYSRDPSNPSSGDIVINASWGLGSYVVDGVVSPDTYRVRKDLEILDINVSDKSVKLILNPDGGLSEVRVEDHLRKVPCLQEEHIRLLARYALELENHYNCPQDIEWALTPENNIVLLQTRPLKIISARSIMEIIVPEDYPVLIHNGAIACPGIGNGPAFHVRSNDDLHRIPHGAVLVAHHSSPRFVLVMDRISAIVTDAGSITGHMASVAREFKIPTLLDTKEATKIIPEGEEITVDAFHGKVYKGALPESLRNLIVEASREATPMKGTPVYRTLEKLARFIVPLNLIDPQAPNFSPEGCKTLHDIMRFVHEKSYSEMFRLSDSLSDEEGNAYRLDAPIPLNLYVIDLGGGLLLEKVKGNKVPVDAVTSVPFRSLLKGMLHEAFLKPAPKPVELGGFFSVLSEQILSNPHLMERFGDKSYAIVSDKYLHFSSRVGYHFALLDSYCGQTINKNYITFAFKGGAADDVRKNRRARAIAKILSLLNFHVEVIADRVEGRLQKYEPSVIESTLDQLGRLLQFTRQMDMLMSSEGMIEVVARAFIQGIYDITESDL